MRVERSGEQLEHVLVELADVLAADGAGVLLAEPLADALLVELVAALGRGTWPCRAARSGRRPPGTRSCRSRIPPPGRRGSGCASRAGCRSWPAWGEPYLDGAVVLQQRGDVGDLGEGEEHAVQDDAGDRVVQVEREHDQQQHAVHGRVHVQLLEVEQQHQVACVVRRLP